MSRRAFRTWVAVSIPLGLLIQLSFAFAVIGGILDEGTILPVFVVLFVLFGVGGFFGFTLVIRRLHDLDRPTSDIFPLDLVDPSKFFTVWIDAVMEPGTPGPNRYGNPPGAN